MISKELNRLMMEIQNGSESAFSDFYQKTYKGVFSFAYTYVKNYHTAEDLVQETYVKVKLNADKYVLGTNATAWVLQIAKNACLDYLRKEKLRNITELKENIATVETDKTDKLFAHELLYKYLKEEDRQIVLLHLLYGFKNREIAEILNMPVGTVLWRYNKALKELKNKLKEDRR